MNYRRLITILLFAGPLSCAAAQPKLDTVPKKISYAIGLQIGQSLLRQGVELDQKIFALGVQDALAGTKPRLSPAEMRQAENKQKERTGEKLRAAAINNLKAGKAFMAKNKQKEGVKELSSGLQYRIIKNGSGRQPKASNSVKVHYTGKLIKGFEFDSSHRRGQPAVLSLNGVIKGWQEALSLMREGAKWQIVLPPALAYGTRGAGAAIGPNETLIFDIELIKIM